MSTIMFFKYIKIGQRFRFEGDLKIYTKTGYFEAERFLETSFVFPDQVAYLVNENEMEDSEAIEKGSAWNMRLEK